MLNTPDTSVHDEEISNNPNMAKARELLTQLKLIEPTEGDSYDITELGRKIADDEGITQDGTLTELGQQLATSSGNNAPPPSGNPSPSGPTDSTPSLNDDPNNTMPSVGTTDSAGVDAPS